METDSSDVGDKSSSAGASTSKKGASKKVASSSKASKAASFPHKESTFSYPVFEEEIKNTCDYTCKMLGFPNRGSLRNLEDFLTDHGKFQIRPVSTFHVILGAFLWSLGHECKVDGTRKWSFRHGHFSQMVDHWRLVQKHSLHS